MIDHMGRTPVYRVDPRQPDEAVLSLAGAILRSGGTVAFPTETVYGLGANALDAQAVRRIFEAKGRPADNPIIVHVSSFDEVRPLVTEIPPQIRTLMRTFWPGPLTILFKRSDLIPDIVTAGLDTVGIRMPDHPVALGIIRHAGVPIAAPSANISSYPSPTTAEHVVHDLDGRIDAVIDGGPTGIGVESTVLDISGDKPLILRPGYITIEDLRPFVPGVTVDPRVDGALSPADSSPPRSPGQKYRHYSPKATVWLVEPDPRMPDSTEDIARRAIRLVRSLLDETRAPVGILASEETEEAYRRHFKEGVVVMTVGSREHLREVASRLFGCLREMDDAGVQTVVAEGFCSTGLGLAIMNRLRRAADFRCFPETVKSFPENAESVPENVKTPPGGCGEEKATKPPGTKKVLFVCTGNTCRSPMAAGLFNHLAKPPWVAESAGMAAAEGEPASLQARNVARRHGVDLSRHRSRRVNSEMIEKADLVLTMTAFQRDMLRRQEPKKADRIFTLKEYAGLLAPPEQKIHAKDRRNQDEGGGSWVPIEGRGEVDVGDPYGLSDEAYEETWRELEKSVRALINKLDAQKLDSPEV
ncbi:MAG TPA: threonylcarbamoyl-AMP synthase [Clostridia bacterium]|nr:threonylcarbamoyl-AMP synthase [Clostridia bacterium]